MFNAKVIKYTPKLNVCKCCVQLLGLETCDINSKSYQIHNTRDHLSTQYRETYIPTVRDVIKITTCGLQLHNCDQEVIPGHLPLEVCLEDRHLKILTAVKNQEYIRKKRRRPQKQFFVLRERKALQTYSQDPKLTPMDDRDASLPTISDPSIGTETPQDIPPWEIIPPEELEDDDEDLF